MAGPQNERDPVGKFGYVTDRGDILLVELTEQVANAGGFSDYDATAPNAKGARGRRTKMRHINVREDNNPKKYHLIPCADDSNTLYTVGGTLNLGGEDCTVISRKGECGKIGVRNAP